MAKFNRAFRVGNLIMIEQFVQNLLQGFEDSRHKVYLIRILNKILRLQMPENFQIKGQQKIALNRLRILQNIMNDNGLCKTLVGEINQHNDEQVAIEAVNLLTSLLTESNTYVQQSLLDFMKANKDNFQFFAYIKEHLTESTDRLVTEIQGKFIEDVQKGRDVRSLKAQ